MTFFVYMFTTNFVDEGDDASRKVLRILPSDRELAGKSFMTY